MVLSLSRLVPEVDQEHVCGFSRELVAEEANQPRELMERQNDPALV
jgi:hypothetical protein